MSTTQTYGVHWQSNSSLLALVGGLLVGSVAGVRMVQLGKVTGISGFVKNLVDPSAPSLNYSRLSSLLLVSGMVCGGGIARSFLNESFEDWSSLPIARLVMAGLLVGFGTALGNGCTSGHGICGLSSFRIRSLVATCTFMIVGIVTAMAANTSAYLPIFENTLPINQSGGIVGVCLLLCLIVILLSSFLGGRLSLQPETLSMKVFTSITEFLMGICFALAMAVSNMTKLSATISFLDLRYWNPALAFVMGGGIFVAVLSFQLAFRFLDKPLLAAVFDLAKSSEIDRKLILGSSIFGLGWGLAGSCPGPAITNLGSGNIYPIIYCACIVVGLYIKLFMDFLITAYSGKGTIHTQVPIIEPKDPIPICEKEEEKNGKQQYGSADEVEFVGTVN